MEGGTAADPSPLGNCELGTPQRECTTRQSAGEGALSLRMDASSHVRGVSCSSPASGPTRCGPPPSPVRRAGCRQEHLTNCCRASGTGAALLASRRKDGPTPLGVPRAPGLRRQWYLEGDAAEAQRETGHNHLKVRPRAGLFSSSAYGSWQDSFLSGCWPESPLSSCPFHRTAHSPSRLPAEQVRERANRRVSAMASIVLAVSFVCEAGFWVQPTLGRRECKAGQVTRPWAIGRHLRGCLPWGGGRAGCLLCFQEDMCCVKATLAAVEKQVGGQGGSRETFWEKRLSLRLVGWV